MKVLLLVLAVVLGYWLLMAMTGAMQGATYPTDEYHPGGYNELFYGD
jgi:hypothetical protein